jgi:RIO kinase 1
VDKADRATVEQALDPRTRIILFKMLNRGIFNEINGCVSTGLQLCPPLHHSFFCS